MLVYTGYARYTGYTRYAGYAQEEMTTDHKYVQWKEMCGCDLYIKLWFTP